MKEAFVFVGTLQYPSCHAATICELPNGDLLAAWYAGSEEGSPDSVILGSLLSASHDTWQPARVWVNVVGHAAGNPRLFVGPDGGVWLLAPINYGRWCQGGTLLFVKRSYDNGETWTDLELFLERRGVLGKNKPVFLEPEIWIIPAEHEEKWEVTFLRSEDNGHSWQLVDCPGKGARLHQPTIVQLSSGELLAYMRSWEGWVYETRSYDTGRSWLPAAPTPLPNNNSGIDMVRLHSGRLALALNPVALGPDGDLTIDRPADKDQETPLDVEALGRADEEEIRRLIAGEKSRRAERVNRYPPWGPRTPLSIAISEDEGQSWQISLVLEKAEGEYSYPAIIQHSDGTIHVLYTYHRDRIKHVCLREEELLCLSSEE